MWIDALLLPCARGRGSVPGMTTDAPARFNPLHGNPLITRSDVAAALQACAAPLAAARSTCGSRLELDGTAASYDQGAAALESFARPLWGLAAAAAGGCGAEDVWRAIAVGISAGTDPAHPSYWGDINDFDQRIVELPAIAFALAVAPGRLITADDGVVTARVAAYMAQARGREVFRNNWLLFPGLIECGIGALGGRRDTDAIRMAMAAVDRFHIGDGWYRDGDRPQIDHYGGFAFHFYRLLIAALAPDAVDRTGVATQATAFAAGFRHWFADDGAALPFGRSLTYRFAAVAFFAACAFAGVEALPWGEMKGIYLRHLRWWRQWPITRGDGVLSIGHGYPNPHAAEDYNGPASPYWAFKAFLPLALPGDHPFWQAEETPHRPALRPLILPGPGMILRDEAGQVAALCSGQAQPRFTGGAEKYAKFAYSTRYAFGVEGPLRRFEEGCFDSMIAFADDTGWRVRDQNMIEIAGDRIVSRWQPWPDVSVTTQLWWDGPWQMRVHHITAPRPLRSIEGGFCLPMPDRGLAPGRPDQGCAWIETGEDFSGIGALDGIGRQGRVHQPAPNRHLLHPRVAVPQLIGTVPAGESRLVCAVIASPDIAAARIAWASPPAVPE